MPPDHLGRGHLGLDRGVAGEGGGKGETGLEAGVGHDGLDPGPTLDGTPASPAVDAAPLAAAAELLPADTVMARPSATSPSNQDAVRRPGCTTRAQQQVVELFGTPEDRHGLVTDPLDGVRIESAERLLVDGKAPPHLHRPGPALLEGGVVEEGERLPVQDLVGEHGGFRRLHEVDPDGSLFDAGHRLHQRVDVHGLVQAVVERLAHQDVVGDDDRPAGQVLLAGSESGEDGRHQVVGLHPLDGQRVLPAATEAQDGQRAVQVPTPTGGEHRRGQHGLREHGGQRGRPQEGGHAVEREAVLRTEREDDSVVIGRGLELEVEGGTEPLPECEAQSLVDPATEGGVDDQLHAAGLVEEALEDDVLLAGDDAQPLPPGGEVSAQLDGRLLGDATGILDVPPGGRLDPRAADAARPPGARPRRSRRAPGCGSGPPPTRTGWWVACPRHRSPAPRRPRPGEPATNGCRAGTRRRPSTRWRSPRSPFPPACRPDRAGPGSRRHRRWRRRWSERRAGRRAVAGARR